MDFDIAQQLAVIAEEESAAIYHFTLIVLSALAVTSGLLLAVLADRKSVRRVGFGGLLICAGVLAASSVPKPKVEAWPEGVVNNGSFFDTNAWRFVEFLLEPANLERHNIECAQIPPRASVANDPAFQEAAPYLKPLIPILDKAEFLGRFNSDILKEYVQQAYVSLVTEDGAYASVEEACQKLTDDLAANMKIY